MSWRTIILERRMCAMLGEYLDEDPGGDGDRLPEQLSAAYRYGSDGQSSYAMYIRDDGQLYRTLVPNEIFYTLPAYNPQFAHTSRLLNRLPNGDWKAMRIMQSSQFSGSSRTDTYSCYLETVQHGTNAVFDTELTGEYVFSVNQTTRVATLVSSSGYVVIAAIVVNGFLHLQDAQINAANWEEFRYILRASVVPVEVDLGEGIVVSYPDVSDVAVNSPVRFGVNGFTFQSNGAVIGPIVSALGRDLTQQEIDDSNAFVKL